jgi:hypothetical protein
MRQYQRLLEDRRNSRRTVADALEVLREVGGFKENDHAQVHVGALRLPSADVVGLIEIRFEHPFQENVRIVSLPSSTEVRAIRTESSRHEHFHIFQLHGAIVSADAKVRLSNGTELRAVEIIPARLPYHPSELDWRIVQHTISILRLESSAYRTLRQDLFPRRRRGGLPKGPLLDCSKLAGLRIDASLKYLTCEIAIRDPSLSRLSAQAVSNALRKFGARIPKPRPRRTSALS